jgi:hypothetical protein
LTGVDQGGSSVDQEVRMVLNVGKGSRCGFKLDLVRFEGEVVPFVHLLGRLKRGLDVRCPACAEALSLRLGRVRSHHAAHRPKSACALNNRETAKHFNAKMALAEALRGATSLDVMQGCRWADCTAKAVWRWAEGWTTVETEVAVGSRRPDVVLWREGVVIGAIEVFVSNEVSHEKAEELAALRLPWVEVHADAILQGVAPSWAAGSPLPIRRSGPRIEAVCAGCAETEQEAAARQAEKRRWGDEQAARFERMTQATQGRTPAANQRRRQDFGAGADGMEAAERQDGMWLRRYLLFEHKGADGCCQKEGLVIASRCRSGQVEASLLVSLRGLQVLHEEPGDAVDVLVEAGERHLASQTGARRTVGWSDLTGMPSRGWFQTWQSMGVDYRRPVDMALPKGWRLSRRTDRPDGLDLLFFLFVYYHHGLERDLQWVSAQARLF